MSNNDWPTAPLIKVVRGKEYDEPVRDALAARDGDGKYLLATGPRAGNSILRKAPSDDIDDWEEITAVPTVALEELKEAWKGFGMYDTDGSQRVTDAITSILSCLPADKPSSLDRAVTYTKNIGARGILEDFTLNDRISLLLAAVRDTHTGEDLRYRLAWIVRLAYTWADLEDPSQDALEEISEHAARILTEGRVNQSDVANLTCWVGAIAAAASGEKSPRPSLIVLGARALAWAAEIIEEEDK
ncbi:hypothetical protein [Actinomyces oris]|uniref:hypothetical protein n=1 Tax=Actinomyces oris TaxID=544580 RepID=UPI002852698A|nr:hypothetical protein [Actinomyces oris]